MFCAWRYCFINTYNWFYITYNHMFHSISSVTQSYPTLCDPIDDIPPGSPVPGILQARILEWVAISFSRESTQPRNWICGSCISRWILYNLATLEAPIYGISSVHSVVSNSLRSHGLQHTRPLCPSPTPGLYSNSSPLSWWCHPTISSSVIPFSSHLQSLPASGSFPMIQFFTSGDQSIGVSASTLVLPMNIQDWFPLG